MSSFRMDCFGEILDQREELTMCSMTAVSTTKLYKIAKTKPSFTYFIFMKK